MLVSKIMLFRFALLWSLVSIGWSQVDTGTIAGVVKDPSGAVVAGATVAIRNVGTGAVHKAFTNSIGEYVSGPLPPGDYTVAAQSSGFRETIAKLTLTLNQRAVLDLALVVGGSDQQVEVTSDTPLVESETSTLDNVRTEQAVKDLPLNGRNFTELIGLATGVMPAQTQTQSLAATAVRGVVANSVNGMGFRANQFLIDGLDNTENHNGQGVILNPPVEAIQEFSVETSVPPAEFGRGGGNINVRIRSGTRDLHGTAFEFLRNSALDAKNFFDPPGKITPFRMNQFGFALGGPVMLPRLYNHDRNKTFFFVDYEGIRVQQAQTFISTVPTPAMKAGIFPTASGIIYDPTTAVTTAQGVQRTPYTNNTIPASEVSKVGQNLINLYPDPNLGGIASNYLYTPAQTTNSNNYDIKIDQSFGASNQAFFRYSKQNTNQLVPGNLPDPAVGSTNAGTFVIPTHQFVMSDTQTLSPHVVNETRAGIGRLYILTEQANYGVDVANQVGIPGINGGNDPLRTGLPTINVTGFSPLGDSGTKPGIIVSENWQYSDNLSWFTGRHSFKFGAQVIRRRYNLLQTNAAHGIYDVTGVYTQNLITPAKTGNGGADLLLGVPADGNINALTGTRGYRRTEMAFFVQDNWRLGQNLTVNWGLRYEAFPGFPWVEVYNRMSNFIPSLGQVVNVGTPQLPERSATRNSWMYFGPRLGLAYKIGNHMVLRAAYGVYYEGEPIPETNLPGSNPPFTGSVAFTNDKTNYPAAITLAQGFPAPTTTVYPTAGASLQAIDGNFRVPYAQQWNLGLQREFRGGIVVSASYVGTKGTALVLDPDVNQPVPGPGAVAMRRPYPLFAGIPTVESVGNSIYHSMQLSAEKRFAKGLSFLLSYTLSHAIDQGDFLTAPQNSLNFTQDRGNGAFDVRNHFSGSWTWALPGHWCQPWNTLLGRWQLNGIASIYSGLPFTVTSSVNTLNGSGTQRVNRIGSGVLPASARSLQEYFNIADFVIPALYQFGNSGRDILKGPGTAQFDGSLFKNFHYSGSDRTYVQFRCEVFNVANAPQFNNPASAVGNPAAGTITSAGSKPTLQRTSRQIQLALKLYF
jgi:hypothetical protein